MKMNLFTEFFLLGYFLVMAFCIEVLEPDQPCAARPVPGKSVVCVCNATYCDTITRLPPARGLYASYISSEDGLRFHKTLGKIQHRNEIRSRCLTTLQLNPRVLYQELSGFGGAITDSTAINLKNLDHPRARQFFMNSYFSKYGLEYNMMRIPIGGTDFSTRPYAYNEEPAGDIYLDNFSLAAEDYDLKIPFIHEAMKVAPCPIRSVGSLWSPPPWMKDSNSFTSGYLKKKYYQTLADYFCKFIENYEKNGIPIWGVTTTNEPLNSIMVSEPINRMAWSAYELGQWVQNHLGPTIKNGTHKNVKLMIGDDQRYTIPLWFNTVLLKYPAVAQYVDGVAVHDYFDKFTPPAQLTLPLQDYPDKFILYTEASLGVTASDDKKVDLGSWERAEQYASNIIEDLNNKVIGWIDWNMCLNETGGPTWVDNRIDSPIIVSAARQEFYKQPMFYALGHFSKFLPRGSRRLHVDVGSPSCRPALPHVAFLTPEKTIVVVLLNTGKARSIVIGLGEDSAVIRLPNKSIATVEFPHQSITAFETELPLQQQLIQISSVSAADCICFGHSCTTSSYQPLHVLSGSCSWQLGAKRHLY